MGFAYSANISFTRYHLYNQQHQASVHDIFLWSIQVYMYRNKSCLKQSMQDLEFYNAYEYISNPGGSVKFWSSQSTPMANQIR